MKRTPLTRRTPLRPSERIKARTPIKAKGPVKGRWAAWQAECRATVAARAGSRCEGCKGHVGRTVLQWAHLFGRRNIVGEPLASSPALTVMLCPECHDSIDGRTATNLNLKEFLQWQAVRRLQAALADEGIDTNVLGFTPAGAVRVLEGRTKLGGRS